MVRGQGPTGGNIDLEQWEEPITLLAEGGVTPKMLTDYLQSVSTSDTVCIGRTTNGDYTFQREKAHAAQNVAAGNSPPF